MKTTKASLQADLEAVKKAHKDDIARKESELQDLKSQISKANSELRLAKQDSDRHQTNWNDCEKRLMSIRQVIASTLDVKHGLAVEPKQEWINNKMVYEDDDSEDVRLLRHLFKLANNQPPF